MRTPEPDITGIRFDRLVVAGRAEMRGSKKMWRCICDCGTRIETTGYQLRSKGARSCGCLRNELSALRKMTHGKYGTKEYQAWQSMKNRCSNQNYKGWKDYGGRGIKVCDRWLDSFENFLADMGPALPGLSLERIHVDQDYEPNNCKWATSSEQNKNRRPWSRKRKA